MNIFDYIHIVVIIYYHNVKCIISFINTYILSNNLCNPIIILWYQQFNFFFFVEKIMHYNGNFQTVCATLKNLSIKISLQGRQSLFYQ